VSDPLVASPLAPALRVPLALHKAEGKPADLHKAALAFEGQLMSMLFQNMRKTVETSGLLGDSGQARSTFEYLFDQAVADAALKGGKGWGLAARLEESWSRQQGAAQSTRSPKAIEENP
jgi:Rod binding domain-containing protein